MPFCQFPASHAFRSLVHGRISATAGSSSPIDPTGVKSASGSNGDQAVPPNRQPVRRRKGPMRRRSRKLSSESASLRPSKRVQPAAVTKPTEATRTIANGDGGTDLLESKGFEMLDDAVIGGPVLETESRPFIPVSIPRSDDGRVFKLPYKPSEFVNDPEDVCILPKPIYVVSDCTGESAANTVRAALGQFENCFKTSCPANLLIFRFVSKINQIHDIVKQAVEDDALIVYTLVDHDNVKAMRSGCILSEVKYVDLWTNLVDLMENHLEIVRSGVPLGQRDRSELSSDYFKMIEAVEFTRKMDDGAHPDRWHEADLLLLGVSRSGKTPLCIYLGQRGYKVANLPLVKGLPIPPQLYEIDQSKIFGLLIDPQTLMEVRQSRMGNMGVQRSSSDYADKKSIQQELGYAQGLYKQNPIWPVLDVTHCGVEETAARILKILTDRMGHLHPIWNSQGEISG